MDTSEIEVDGYQKVIRGRDEASGLHALIAVHDTTLGPALGGMRMLPYASEDEALFDVLRLSKGMTYKSAVADTGLGGGKCVILGDPKKAKSEALFEAMGDFVNSLDGLYITAEDMNIGIPDLEIVKRKTRWVTGLSRESGSSGNPSPYTASGCLFGMRAVLQEAFGNPDPAGRRILIQGIGAVGGRLAVLLKDAGAEVIICDINEARVEQMKAEHGFESVPDETHLDTECDVYSPCARGAGINDETIPKLKCKAVAGCANNQLLDFEHAEALRAAGILYAPDYVINAGGIINVSVELLPEGYNEAVAMKRIEGITSNLAHVFEIAKAEGIATNKAALMLAEKRLAEKKA